MAENSVHSNAGGRMSKMMKDMGIYAIGNLGSKVITFLMVPLYTYYVENTADFGYYDICLTVVFLLMPFVTLQLRDGAFRFLLDADSDDSRRKVVSMTYKTLGAMLMLSTAVALCIATCVTVRYLWLVVALLAAMSVQEVVSQVFRGLGNNKAFVSVGILSAFFIGAFSLLFVVWLGMGIEGVFIANILARFAAVGLVELKIGTLRKYFSVSVKYRETALEVLKYTLPLLPGSLCWWLTGSSDRWFIQEYLGLEVNGVYAVAVRFMSILQTLALIFYQAWQETAINQYHSEDRNKFFSQVFCNYIFVTSLLLVGFCFGLKMCYGWLVESSYQSSLQYIFPLALSTAIFAIVAYFDMGYQCAKDTKRTLPAIVLSAAVNVTLNFLLTSRFGVWGVIATLNITYLVLVVYRWYDTKRYFTLSVNRGLLLPIAVMLGSAVPFYMGTALWHDLLALAATLALMVACCPSEIRREV
ncbi:MAG: oligosaccharide flippase family protein, partial [Bacteroidales bacterium]|nr:oligosaccharide flippase family protein [Bacteroidales bacterium]